MSGIDRYIRVLDLFTTEKSMWTVQEVATRLNVPISTTYRAMRELARVNMLEPAMEGCYRLGAAFVEFDRRTRLTDPLVMVGEPMLTDIADHANLPCVAVLARLYGNTVMCIADRRSAGSAVQTSYERGRPRPLMRGATSKVILAQLTTRRLNKLLAIADSSGEHVSSSEATFRDELDSIRKNGYCVARGEVDEGRVGIAVPISVSEQALMASLSLVIDADSSTEAIERRLVLLLVSSAALLKEQLSKHFASLEVFKGIDPNPGSRQD
jgi:DNA-binding IclR family transcriptional regulator